MRDSPQRHRERESRAVTCTVRGYRDLALDRPGDRARSLALVLCCAFHLHIVHQLPAVRRPHLPGEAAVHHPARPAGRRTPRTSRFPTADGLTLHGCYLQDAASRARA